MATMLITGALSLFLQALQTNVSVHGEGFLAMDTLRRLPAELKDVICGTFIKGYRFDYDGDGKKDYICWLSSHAAQPVTTEYWVTAGYHLTKTLPKHGEDYDFLWLINLDNDPEAEIVRASGYEDGIDYMLLDPGVSGATENIVCYFNPVIIDGSKYRWGYPWDILEIITFQANDIVYMQASLDHDIQRDGVVTIPKPPARFPVLFFIGRSTQYGTTVNNIHRISWLSIDDLKAGK